MKVTDVTAAFLVQQLQGQQTQQRTRSLAHARTRILSAGNEVVESDPSQKRQEEDNTDDPRAQAASRRQRDLTHIRRMSNPGSGIQRGLGLGPLSWRRSGCIQWPKWLRMAMA